MSSSEKKPWPILLKGLTHLKTRRGKKGKPKFIETRNTSIVWFSSLRGQSAAAKKGNGGTVDGVRVHPNWFGQNHCVGRDISHGGDALPKRKYATSLKKKFQGEKNSQQRFKF